MSLSWLASLFEGQPQHMSFDEIRRLREQAETLQRQQQLAVEERRAFAREYVTERPVVGSLAMLVAPPAEQAYKGINHLMGRQIGRSGYFDPMANIGAAYYGALEGLAGKRGGGR